MVPGGEPAKPGNVDGSRTSPRSPVLAAAITVESATADRGLRDQAAGNRSVPEAHITQAASVVHTRSSNSPATSNTRYLPGPQSARNANDSGNTGASLMGTSTATPHDAHTRQR